MLNATLTQSEASCSTQLYYMLVVQGYCFDTSRERWSTGGQGGMEMLGPASRTDLADTQCGSVARALELQLRGRDGGSNGTVEQRQEECGEVLMLQRHGTLPSGPKDS